MKDILSYLFFLLTSFVFSQSSELSKNINDSKYREDQFYVGISYNFLENKPSGMSQQGLSGGFHLGFVRDFPINKRRNIALGIGIGYSTNSYNHNLFIKEESNTVTYKILNNNDQPYSKNKLNIHVIEMPLQFRWRTSTMNSYKFWRIYTGVKFGYVVNSIVKYNGDLGDFKQNSTSDVNRFVTYADISFGWNTWNFYISYGLNDLFSDQAFVDSKPIDVSEIKFGLMFYLF